MNRHALLVTSLTLGLAALAPQARAVEAATDPVGAMVLSMVGHSDTTLSIPFTRPIAFRGLVDTASANGTTGTITVKGTPNWTAGQFTAEGHYLLVEGGTDEGLFLVVTANSANSVDVDLSDGSVLTNVTPDTRVSIIPFWTPDSVFGAASVPDGSLLLLFDATEPGTNLSASRVLQVYESVWYDLTNDFAEANDFMLHPGESYLLRNEGSSFDLVLSGGVPMSKHRVVLKTLQAATEQDIRIAFQSPVPEKLSATGYPAADGDILLAFNNQVVDINKSAAQVIQYYSGVWYDLTNDFADVTNTFELQPGLGYVIRKSATANPASFVWQGKPSYLP